MNDISLEGGNVCDSSLFRALSHLGAHFHLWLACSADVDVVYAVSPFSKYQAYQQI